MKSAAELCSGLSAEDCDITGTIVQMLVLMCSVNAAFSQAAFIKCGKPNTKAHEAQLADLCKDHTYWGILSCIFSASGQRQFISVTVMRSYQLIFTLHTAHHYASRQRLNSIILQLTCSCVLIHAMLVDRTS